MVYFNQKGWQKRASMGWRNGKIVICAMQYCERAKSSPSYSPSKTPLIHLIHLYSASTVKSNP